MDVLNCPLHILGQFTKKKSRESQICQRNCIYFYSLTKKNHPPIDCKEQHSTHWIQYSRGKVTIWGHVHTKVDKSIFLKMSLVKCYWSSFNFIQIGEFSVFLLKFCLLWLGGDYVHFGQKEIEIWNLSGLVWTWSAIDQHFW